MKTDALTARSAPAGHWPTAADLILGDVLFDRSMHSTSLRTEKAAARELSHVLDDGRGAVRRFLDVASHMCHGGSAGVSLLSPGAFGKRSLQWRAVSGALAEYEGIAVPRDFSTCGLCLDDGGPIVLEKPERLFDYLLEMPPTIAEALVVPLYLDEALVGTLWIVHHDDAAHFRSDDVRIAERLSLHLVWAMKLLQVATENGGALGSSSVYAA